MKWIVGCDNDTFIWHFLFILFSLYWFWIHECRFVWHWYPQMSFTHNNNNQLRIANWMDRSIDNHSSTILYLMPINKCSITFVVSFFLLLSLCLFLHPCILRSCFFYDFVSFFVRCIGLHCNEFFSQFVFIVLIPITHYRHFKSCYLSCIRPTHIRYIQRSSPAKWGKWISCSCSWVLAVDVDLLFAIEHFLNENRVSIPMKQSVNPNH